LLHLYGSPEQHDLQYQNTLFEDIRIQDDLSIVSGKRAGSGDGYSSDNGSDSSSKDGMSNEEVSNWIVSYCRLVYC